MWEMITDMMPRRKRGLNTVTAMVIGAGVGIAAWEMMRRNNVAGDSTDDMSRIADSMMDAIDMD
ncbi:hypothetical protein [Tumebacillus flagellatus]|uniref:Uncharacterized protein n=1 Tax=Tumebacillus flagellatus TaxID=1157490 RepID=A0A074LTS5_9BACL|nr:hypothetical protein [Tumebacillus flagellatus]KEO84539.1 hypothetical protein EL26_03200 [Tumebacillus flagellatus]